MDKVFQGPDDVLLPYGIAAAGGPLLYLLADVVLTGSLVRQFQAAALINVSYDFEAQLYLNVTGAGAVTTSVGVTGSSPPMRQIQQAQTTAVVCEQQSSSGTGDRVIASSSISTGTRSIVVRGSAKPALAGTLFLDMSTAGTVTLQAGSTFRMWRTN